MARPQPVGSPLLRELGRRVRQRRTELGMSQIDLGEASELHFTYISQVEGGTRNVSLENLVRLARGLRMDLGDLTAGLQRKRGRSG